MGAVGGLTDNDKEDCSDGNLKAMCQQCHNRYDAPMRRRGIRERANADQLTFLDGAT